MIFREIAVSDNCRNPDSMGMICCLCNACGRDKARRIPTLDEMESMALEQMDADEIKAYQAKQWEAHGQLKLPIPNAAQ